MHIQDAYELAQAPDALTALATTHTQGKRRDPTRVTVDPFDDTRRSAGRTKVARPCKTRQHAATSDTPKPARLHRTRMGRPPPHVHGKEGVDGSSPSEGFEKNPANHEFLPLSRCRCW
jgi:hypothetical protein